MFGELIGNTVGKIVRIGGMVESAGRSISLNASYASHLVAAKIAEIKGIENKDAMGVEEALAKYYKNHTRDEKCEESCGMNEVQQRTQDLELLLKMQEKYISGKLEQSDKKIIKENAEQWQKSIDFFREKCGTTREQP